MLVTPCTTTVSPSVFSVPSHVLSLPSPQETPRCFQKKPRVPQLRSLLFLLLGSSVPFSHPFSSYFPSHSVDAQNLSYSIRTASETENHGGITFSEV